MHNNLTRDEIKDGIDKLADRLREAMDDDTSSPNYIENLVGAIRRLEALLAAKRDAEAAATLTKRQRDEQQIYRTADRLLGRTPS